MYYLCEKHYKSIPVQSYMTDYITWVPRLTVGLMNKLDLWTPSRNGTCLFVGDLLYPNLGLKASDSQA